MIDGFLLKKNKRVKEVLKSQIKRPFAAENEAEEGKLMAILEDSPTID